MTYAPVLSSVSTVFLAEAFDAPGEAVGVLAPRRVGIRRRGGRVTIVVHETAPAVSLVVSNPKLKGTMGKVALSLVW